MVVYLIVMILSLLTQLIPVNNNKQYKRRLFFTFLPIFLFGALRVTIGDGLSYEEDFNYVHSMAKFSVVHEHNELGFMILMRIIPTYRLLIIFITALMCISYGVVFYKNIPPKNSWLAVLLLFLMGNYTIFFVLGSYRNGIGICIMLLSLPFIQRRKIVIFALFTALASTMHTSMLFSMPLAYLIGQNKSLTKREIYIWLGCACFFIFSSASGLLNFITPYINEYFYRYDSVITALEENVGHKGYLNILGCIILLCGILIMMKKTEFEPHTSCVCRLGMLYAFAGLLGVLNARMSECYSIFMITTAAIMLSKQKEFNKSKWYLVFLILYSSYDFYLWIHSEWSGKHLIYNSIIGNF